MSLGRLTFSLAQFLFLGLGLFFFENWYCSLAEPAFKGWGWPEDGDSDAGVESLGSCQAGLLGVLQDFARSGNKVIACSFQILFLAFDLF